MTLDEAIKHAEEVAEEKENEGKLLCQSEGASIGCLTCAEEHRQLAEWLRDYKRLKEQEPCEDAISRQAALDIAFKYCPDDDGTCLEARSDLRNMLDEIEALPPAQPERKKGQWMKEDRGHVEYCAVCDQCGFDWIWSDREYFKFCPNCGADMRGEQDG